MKKLLSIFAIALISAFAMTACSGGDSNDGDADGGDTTVVETSKFNSEYFEKVVFTNDGEFVGLSFGDSRETVKSKLPADAFDDETDNYLYYYWEMDNNQYYLDLYFDDEDKLNSIDGYVYFYDANDNYDEAEASAFYTDMRENFVAKYGNEEEVSESGYTYTYWYFDEKDVEVGLDEGEVYWYMYYYEPIDM